MSDLQIDVSVVIPCLNEESSIGLCVDKARNYFSRKKIMGEVIVVDNGSTDRSAEIALEKGAYVVRETVKGYGSAYLRGFREARGRYMVMADADNTYDLSDLDRFLDPLRGGAELVMGSRFRGKIHPGAMPWANRYIGNPILTGLYRLFFKTSLTDIHCGMRSFTREAYQKLNLHCLGMEFASEMIMEALQKKIKIVEAPIDYFPRKGVSKLQPMQDAWRHLRFMLLFCPDWLYFVPGAVMSFLGLTILSLLVKGPVYFLGRSWDIHMLILAAFMSIFGFQIIIIGLYAKMFAIQQKYIEEDRVLSWFTKHLKLEFGILMGILFFLLGFAINSFIFIEWWKTSFGALYRMRESIFAMTLMFLGLQTIFSSFFLSLLVIRR